MKIPRHSFDAPREVVSNSLETHGCLILEGGAAAPKVDDLWGDMRAELDKTPFGDGWFVGRKTKRLGAAVRRFKPAQFLAVQPSVLACMDAILLPNCTSYQLHITQAIDVHAQEQAQVIHRDNSMYPHARVDGELMVNAMWAVTPFTASNGATRVVPGSHLWAEDREPQPHEIQCAEMLPGSVFLYLGSTLHGAGENTASAPRTGLVMGYSLGWLRQYENQYLAVGEDAARSMSHQLASLIGYAAHRPNLGLIECRDPIEFLAAGFPDRVAAQDVLDPSTQKVLDALCAAD